MTDVSKNRTKNLSSFRTLPLIPEVEQALLAAKEQQKAQKKLCGRSYCKDYQEYICVDEMGQIVSPDYVTRVFPAVLMANNRKKIRFHDLRHPYVKPTTKKFLSFFKFEMAISLRAFLCFALLLGIKEGPQLVPFIR